MTGLSPDQANHFRRWSRFRADTFRTSILSNRLRRISPMTFDIANAGVTTSRCIADFRALTDWYDTSRLPAT